MLVHVLIKYLSALIHFSLVMTKSAFCISENKDAVTAQLISAFVFANRIVQSLFFLNPKFQAPSQLLWLYSPVCVGPGRKPRRPVFSQRGLFEPFRDSATIMILATYGTLVTMSHYDQGLLCPHRESFDHELII